MFSFLTTEVLFPYFQDHPQHELAKKQQFWKTKEKSVVVEKRKKEKKEGDSGEDEYEYEFKEVEKEVYFMIECYCI
jgi:hypothetical protein